MNPNDVLIYIGELSFENRGLKSIVDHLRQENEQLKAQIKPVTAEVPAPAAPTESASAPATPDAHAPTAVQPTPEPTAAPAPAA